MTSALTFPGLSDLIATTRSNASGRTTSLTTAWDRRLQLTAVRLERSLGGRGGLISLMLDDITELVRTSEAAEREAERLNHVLGSLNALAWEFDEDFTVLAVSRNAYALTGLRDIDLLGRPSLVALVPAHDRERFIALCRDLQPCMPVQVHHDLNHNDGARRSGCLRWWR